MINVTFKYSDKEYNRIRQGLYIKSGYRYEEINLKDSADVRNGELIAIQVDMQVSSPLPQDVLGKYFYFHNGVYKAKSNIKTLHTVKELREILYRDGFWCDGIHYIRFKRSSGSSRVGKCLFIDENLYKPMHKWEMCGLKFRKEQQIDLAALESYIALSSSSIIDTMEIHPHNILVIDDYESEFQDRVIAVTEDKHGWLEAKPDTVTVSNSIWDGQSLMDVSLFGEYDRYGFLLLRNRFFKSACFNCNIQQWFQDQGITSISQLNGFTLANQISDIKLITTPSSIKYCKFGSVKEWLEQLEPMFGIVKHEKPPHFFDGRMVQAHYQLINTLQMDEQEMQEFVQPTLDYITLLKTDPDVVRHHIKYPVHATPKASSLLSKNDIVYKMMGVNNRFCETKLYAGFLRDLIRAYVKNARCGHILVRGAYSTMLGNGLEMLQASIGAFNGEAVIPTGFIHSKLFDYGKTILGSRSPHVCNGNVWLTTNIANDDIDRYFNLTPEIVYINSIGDNILQRLNGADFDSDSLLLTDNSHLISAARKNYDKFLVPTCFVEAKKIKRYYTPDELADLDIKTSVNKIGEIINLSQELNTQLWNMMNNGSTYEDIEPLYCDISKLAILSGIEIDKAKKEFVVDSVQELKKMKKKYNLIDKNGKKIKPNFFGIIAKTKGYYDPGKKSYLRHETAMDHLQKCINRFQVRKKQPKAYYPFSKMLEFEGFEPNLVYRSQAKRVISMIRETRNEINKIWSDDVCGMENDNRAEQSLDVKARAIQYIDDMKMNPHTMYWLLVNLEKEENADIYRTMFNILFAAPSKDFFSLIECSIAPLDELVEVQNGDIDLYGFKYIKKSIDRTVCS